MRKYEIAYFDTCLPDYFGGHHLPVLQVPVSCTTTMQDLYNDLITWDAYDHIDNVNDILYAAAVEKVFAFYKQQGTMGTLLDPNLPNYDYYDEEDTACLDSVYAFFTLDKHDTVEELLEYQDELQERWQTLNSQGASHQVMAEAVEAIKELRASVTLDQLTEVQMNQYPESKILTEDQVWLYINHFKEGSRSRQLCTMTMESANQESYKHLKKLYYIVNNDYGWMGVRLGLEGQDYISGFVYGKEGLEDCGE